MADGAVLVDGPVLMLEGVGRLSVVRLLLVALVVGPLEGSGREVGGLVARLGDGPVGVTILGCVGDRGRGVTGPLNGLLVFKDLELGVGLWDLASGVLAPGGVIPGGLIIAGLECGGRPPAGLPVRVGLGAALVVGLGAGPRGGRQAGLTTSVILCKLSLFCIRCDSALRLLGRQLTT